MITFKAVGLRQAIKANDRLSRMADKTIIRNVKRATMKGTSEIRRLASGPILKVRSNRYRSSVRHRFEDGGHTGRTGPGVEYGAQKEFGGTITPKRARWLTIPLKGALTASGVARRRITEYQGFFRRTDTGELFFFGSPTTGSKKVVPLFRLVKKVKQEPKKVVGTAHKNIADKVGAEFRKDLHMTVRKAIA